MDDEAFQKALVEVVEKALVAVLGEKVATALRFYVDLKSGLKNLDRFMAVMFELVGPGQTERLRGNILESAYKTYNLAYSPAGANFAEELARLKSQVK